MLRLHHVRRRRGSSPRGRPGARSPERSILRRIQEELASSTCSIACQDVDDSECPGTMTCHEGTGCSGCDSFWCGPTWIEAAEQCGRPCSTGGLEECDDGESCFAHTGCQANLFFCGDTFEDAGESCREPCPRRSLDESSDGKLCFAFVTAYAGGNDDSPTSTRPVSSTSSQEYSFGIAMGAKARCWDATTCVAKEIRIGTLNGEVNTCHPRRERCYLRSSS
mmetsp:Transcript_10203/g.24978  ORF Transcript_10203/g.24978 Transcript_10203/m.24978 type:complete len:222 (+) Transcript_10203:373-1038(+)